MTRLDLVRHLTTVMYHRQVNPNHALTIFIMAERPHGLSRGDLQRLTGLHEKTARRTLDALVDQGYATRATGQRTIPTAHPPYIYHLTPEGTRLGTELLTPKP